MRESLLLLFAMCTIVPSKAVAQVMRNCSDRAAGNVRSAFRPIVTDPDHIVDVFGAKYLPNVESGLRKSVMKMLPRFRNRLRELARHPSLLDDLTVDCNPLQCGEESHLGGVAVRILGMSDLSTVQISLCYDHLVANRTTHCELAGTLGHELAHVFGLPATPNHNANDPPRDRDPVYLFGDAVHRVCSRRFVDFRLR